MRYHIFVLSLFYFVPYLSSQSSFLLDLGDALWGLGEVQVLENQSVGIVFQPSLEISFATLSPYGQLVSSHTMNVQIGSVPLYLFLFHSYQYSEGYHIFFIEYDPAFQFPARAGFVLFNELDFSHWAVSTYDGQVPVQDPKAFFINQDTFVSTYWAGTSRLGVAAYSISTHSQLWAYSYDRVNAIGDLKLGDADKMNDGGISWFMYNSSKEEFLLLHINPLGEIVKALSFSLPLLDLSYVRSMTQEIDADGNIYLAFTLSAMTIDGSTYIGGIAKFNSDYELTWSKEILVENYAYKNLYLKTNYNKDLLFCSVSDGDLPVIVGSLDSNGYLLWSKGYSFYEPRIDIAEDGSLYFLSNKKYHADGTTESKWILAKTDTLGEIESCPQYASCMSIGNMVLEVSSELWMREDGPLHEDTMPIQFSIPDITLTPYCGSPTPPHPYFYLPDTICAGECLTPDSTYNRLAHQVEWYITGPGGLDTTIIDTTFTWCFDEPGHYQVEQGIWLLGCSDYYLRDVVVLPDDLAPALGEDRVLCEQPPYSLSANASRPLRSYLWSDGSTAAELQITASGTYWLEASDGYCMLRDTVQLTFLDDLLTQGSALSLPADTAVCEQHLPYELLPQSPYAEGFSVPAISNSSASSFKLWQAGSYEVQAEVFGCPIRDTFALEVNDCHSRIYFPTAFSPNGDGLNDLFLPQGKDYEGIELQVYDRWGGLLFSSQSPPFAWDGADAAGGVYVYRFRYWNSLALQEEEISGQVVLLR